MYRNALYIGLFFSLCVPIFAVAQDYYCTNSIRYNVWSDLRLNADVVRLQKFLVRELYLDVTPTGNFLELTKSAVRAWQINNGVYETATVGSLTRQAINKQICAPQAIGGVEYHRSPELPLWLRETATKQVVLAVPLIEQLYSLSCEVASLQMALAYRGVIVSQDILAEKVGVAEPFVQTKTDTGVMWGDPDQAFVGSIKGFIRKRDGSFLGATGWGVNNGPVARVAKEYRADSIDRDNATLDDVKEALENDKPVIFWHVRGGKPNGTFTYRTPEGKLVTMMQDHVALIVGYVEQGDQMMYIVNDPQFGRLYVPEAELLAWWDEYNNEMVIIG